MRNRTREPSDGREAREVVAWGAAFFIVLLAAVTLFTLRSTVREERAVAATVRSAAWHSNDDTGQRYPVIEAVLANRRVVRVRSIAPALPEIGSHILLMKRHMLLGYTTYRWEGDLPPATVAGPEAPPAGAASKATPVSLP